MDSVTLAEARNFLEVAHTAQDDRITDILNGIESRIQSVCGIYLSSAGATDNADGGGHGLLLPRKPVTAVTSVTDSQLGTVETDYTLVDDALFLDTGCRWPEDPPGRWTVVYTGGYTAATIPARIKMLVLQLAYREFHNRGGKATQGASGYGVTWTGSDSEITTQLMQLRSGGSLIG